MAAATSSPAAGAGRPRSGAEIRAAFLDFYEQRGHTPMASASLIPDDPTVLLTIAGMLPFKPVFLGQQPRPAPRATSSQKCIRTNDIENVGRTARHHTFFEMLGNFSFGDYFKEQAIQWAWELSTEVFGLSPRNLVVSVFREDDEAEAIWRDVVGVNPKRIIRMDEADNFWASGPTGPCGPCSEIYYDFKPELGDDGIDLEDDSRFIEFYNLVFMQYNRDAEGTLTPLANRNIDTGLGLERMAQILQGGANNYETDLIYPLIETAAGLAGVDYRALDEKGKTSLKVIGDHSRAITQLICDGVTASNLGRGYILRRLLRRVVRHGRLLGIDKPFLTAMGEASIALMQDAYPQLLERREVILAELAREEARFLETLERGEKLLADVLAAKPKQISGAQAFELYDTYGFPLELTEEIAEEHGLTVDLAGFEAAMEAQRQRAKAAAVSIDLTLQEAIDQVAAAAEATAFKGYGALEHPSCVLALVVNGEPATQAVAGDSVQLVLDSTPFYGEGGGQVGDRGVLSGDGVIVSIAGVSRNRSVFVHSGQIERGSCGRGRPAHRPGGCRLPPPRPGQPHGHPPAAGGPQAGGGSWHRPGRLAGGLRPPALRLPLPPRRDARGAGADRGPDQRLDQRGPLPGGAGDGDRAGQGGRGRGDVRREVRRRGAGGGCARRVDGALRRHPRGQHRRDRRVQDHQRERRGRRHPPHRGGGRSGGAGLSEGARGGGEAPGRALQGPARRDRGAGGPAGRGAQGHAKSPGGGPQRAGGGQGFSRWRPGRKRWGLLPDGAPFQLLVARLDGVDGAGLQTAAQGLADQLGDGAAVVLGGLPDPADLGKVILVAAFGQAVIAAGPKAGAFIGGIAKLCGGGGGGRPNLAQAGGRDGAALDGALTQARSVLHAALG
jgi:alanyl-tRNA synthetase